MAICQIFREQFGKAYKKYVKPKKNEKGVEDKVNIIQMFREKTKQLQIIRKSQLEEEDDSNSETLNTQVNEINLANQLIGEVQGFIFVVRWLIYEFYQFKKFN